MAILQIDELVTHFPELGSLDVPKLEALLLNANVFVEGQVFLAEPVPADLKLATAMIVKDMSRERKVTSTKQGDFQESFAYVNHDPLVEQILSKYRNKGKKLWMI